MWELWIVFIILMGISHGLRDSRLYQNTGNTYLVDDIRAQWFHNFYSGTFHQREGGETIQGARPDFAHLFDTTMRWSSAGYGVATVSLNLEWYWSFALWLAGLYAAEWIFTIWYHWFNPHPGHPDHMPLVLVLRWLVFPFKRPVERRKKG